MLRLGVDTGGTFTDLVLWDGENLRVHKVLSTPDAPERAILQGIRELGLQGQRFRMVHGSTVATNAVLEGKGVRTAFVTNRGFADLLSIGRQNRAELYNLQPEPVPPPVTPELCLETGGRLAADGRLLESLSEADLAELSARLHGLAPRSVAVVLLHSYLDGEAERRIAAALPEDLFVSVSSEVLPEIGEYERGIATWLNAWIGPLVDGYLRRLRDGIGEASVAVMQSSGDTIAAQQAGRQAVRMLLSGPAGGLVAARLVGAAAGRQQLLSFDMGGTSTDVALIDGEPRLTNRGRISRYPVAVPMVDMHTIGAGGGSIVWLDAGGMLQVGPESAGADPGPASYGRDGRRPTVTDAHVVLGRIRPDRFLGGTMPLDAAAARAAFAPLSALSGQPIEEIAAGAIAIANEHMARALRVISVQRGIEPRGFTLLSFGGAGGLHVCELAEALGLRQAMVPVHGGVLSALGMLAARPGRRLSQARLGLLSTTPLSELEAGFAALRGQGIEALMEEGIDQLHCSVEYSVDLRYQGQSYSLELPWSGVQATEEAFHLAHLERYGHRLDFPVELVNIRVAVRGPEPKLLVRPSVAQASPDARADSAVVSDDRVSLYERASLAVGEVIAGPAIISEGGATTWLKSGWTATVHASGSLLLERSGID